MVWIRSHYLIDLKNSGVRKGHTALHHSHRPTARMGQTTLHESHQPSITKRVLQENTTREGNFLSTY